VSLAEALPIGLLGALLGLDVVSFPQAMISRPIVAATLAGAFIGNPPAGLLIGVVLEMIALDTLPFGASRYPEWGSAGVVGGSLFAAQAPSMPGALPATLLAALLTASISGWSMVVLRRTIALRLERVRNRLEDGSRDSLLSLHLTGMSLDLLRGALVTITAMLIFSPLVRAIVAVWGSESAASRAVVVVVAAIVAGGALWKVFHSVRHILWFFLAGLLVWSTSLLMRQ
jgi:mannose/fructose/N-acetylgalactosamine-specific phosphotransferase system component IIC